MKISRFEIYLLVITGTILVFVLYNIQIATTPKDWHIALKVLSFVGIGTFVVFVIFGISWLNFLVTGKLFNKIGETYWGTFTNLLAQLNEKKQDINVNIDNADRSINRLHQANTPYHLPENKPLQFQIPNIIEETKELTEEKIKM